MWKEKVGEIEVRKVKHEELADVLTTWLKMRLYVNPGRTYLVICDFGMCFMFTKRPPMKASKITEQIKEKDMSKFEKEIQHLLNSNGMENDSNTPDFILAQYLQGCLNVFNIAVRQRETWYGRVGDIYQLGNENDNQ